MARRIVVVGHGAAGLCAALTAPNAVAMVRALVFGRIAGRNAV